MNPNDPIPELDPDVLSVVREARRIVEPDDVARARMRARLRAALPPAPGGGDGGDDGGAASPAPTTTPTLPKVPLWTVAAALAVGLTGGLLYPRTPVERVVTIGAPPVIVTSADRASAPPTVPSIAIADLPSALPDAPLPSARVAAASASSGNALEAERALLDVARTALGRGDGPNALDACDAHAKKFPRGALGEEREAIAVQALVLAQRSEDAKQRAERFRKAYPRSILLPAVLAAAGIEP
ncbi:MAG: hypothetical protein JST00_44645 [Deltaproteobacteria bacterium]|nr:hypothetical protein [Deltaproteobacteria bacterium]